MDLPLQPGNALNQPTRARLFALLGELRRPAGTADGRDATARFARTSRLIVDGARPNWRAI